MWIKRDLYETDYFAVTEHVNNSLLGLWQEDPIKFWDVWYNGISEETNSYMEWGKAVHMYVLQPKRFKNNYMIANKSKPKSKNAEDFIRNIADEDTSIDFEQDLRDTYKRCYTCTGLDKKEILSRARALYEEMKGYKAIIKHVEAGGGVISEKENDMLKGIVRAMEEHKEIDKLIYRSDGLNEWEYRWEQEGIKCKCMADAVREDKDGNIHILDLKTSSKSPKEFIKNVQQRNNWYIQQLAFYSMGLYAHIEAHKEKNKVYPSEYRLFHDIIYISSDRNTTNPSVYLIQLNMAIGYECQMIRDKLEEIKRCLKERNIGRGKGYYDNNGLDFTVNIDYL